MFPMFSSIAEMGGKKPPTQIDTLLGTNISPEKSILKMIFLFPRWDMLISWRVFIVLVECFLDLIDDKQ